MRQVAPPSTVTCNVAPLGRGALKVPRTVTRSALVRKSPWMPVSGVMPVTATVMPEPVAMVTTCELPKPSLPAASITRTS
ncbi:hypothetical protein D9M68_790710 [compost metagenome]